MDRSAILEAIRDATERNGSPPGRAVFEKLTGIKTSEWYGRYWASWGAALKDAGFEPNELQTPLERDRVAAAYLSLVAELGRIPSSGELRLKTNNTPSFPSYNTFQKRLGRKRDLLAAVLAYAERTGADERIVALLRSVPAAPKTSDDAYEEAGVGEAEHDGFVYLMKSGKYYRIGRTNKLDRRQYEVGVQLPEAYQRVHSIRTDDPSGIEAYWHNRFADKRMNGDWFRLTTSDVKAFKRRKFM